MLLLKERKSAQLVEVTDLAMLVDPTRDSVPGRREYGEELQDTEPFAKAELCFPSGESLPECWKDSHYRDHELRR